MRCSRVVPSFHCSIHTSIFMMTMRYLLLSSHHDKFLTYALFFCSAIISPTNRAIQQLKQLPTSLGKGLAWCLGASEVCGRVSKHQQSYNRSNMGIMMVDSMLLWDPRVLCKIFPLPPKSTGLTDSMSTVILRPPSLYRPSRHLGAPCLQYHFKGSSV